jgi:hypothetical protein
MHQPAFKTPTDRRFSGGLTLYFKPQSVPQVLQKSKRLLNKQAMTAG